MNVTVVNPTAAGFLTVWPTDAARPGASSLNWIAGQPPTPNAVSSKLSLGGQISVFASGGTVDVLVDVNGYYVHHNHDDRYYTKAQIGASYKIETGLISLGAGQYTSGTLQCPAGTVAVGTGLSMAGINTYVSLYTTFVGYFLSNDYGFSTIVSAQAICLQSPPPAIVSTEGAAIPDSVAAWLSDLATHEQLAAKQGYVEATD